MKKTKPTSARLQRINELLEDNPEIPHRTAARLLYEADPELWNNLETARSHLRRVTGNFGVWARKNCKQPYKRPPRQPGEFPVPESKYESPTPFWLKPGRIFIFSDTHIPFHDAKALRTVMNECSDFAPDTILLNGDIADFFSISRWDKDPKYRNLPGEILTVTKFLTDLREHYPKATIIWKEGNHEERWKTYLWKRAPDIATLPALRLQQTFGLDELGVDYVENRNLVMAGRHLPILHGHEFPRGITSPVNQARGQFLRAVECCVAGHGHRTSEHHETTLLDRLISCWSMGCVCGRHPHYMPINKWNHGFMRLTLNPNDDFDIQNKRIRDGKVL